MSNIEQKNLIVTQANQVAIASYSLTLEEKRVVLFLTSLIQKDDKDFQVYRIPVVNIMSFLNIKGKDFYSRLRDLAKNLRSRSLSIEKPNGGWIETGWISYAEYKPKDSEEGLEYACLDLSFDPRMKLYFLELKSQFFSYMLENVASLKSIYSIRFYEIFASYRRLGVVSFEVEDLKRRLQISDKYKYYNDFRRNVLFQAQEELKEKTDVYFEYTEERQKQKVYKIHFTIFSQKTPGSQADNNLAVVQLEETEQSKEDLFVLTPEQQEADSVLELNGVDRAGREILIKSCSVEQIIGNAKIVLEKFQAGKIDNLASATVVAVKEDWRAKKSPYEIELENKKQALMEEIKKAEENKKLIEGLEKEFNESRRTKTENAYNSKTEEEKNSIIKLFELSLKSNFIISGKYEKEGFDNVGVKIMFNLFLAERLLEPEDYNFIKWVKAKKGLNVVKNSLNEYAVI